MTIEAAAEKPDQVLFIKTEDTTKKGHYFKATCVGKAALFFDDEFFSVAAGDFDAPPNPGTILDSMENSVVVQGFKQEGLYGGVVDGVQIPPGFKRSIKGIIFKGK